MKLLTDKYFDENENLEGLGNLKELNNKLDTIKKVVSDIFEYYNFLVVSGSENIIERTKDFLEEQKKKYRKDKIVKDNDGKNYDFQYQFIEYIFIYWSSNETNGLLLASRLYDSDLGLIEDEIDENELKGFRKISHEYNASDYMIGLRVNPGMPMNPPDLWYFSNFEELENGFITNYTKFKEIEESKKGI